MKLRVALDFDNTLCDSIQVWHNIFKNTFPEKEVPCIRDLRDWRLNDSWGVSDEEKDVIFNIFRHKAVKYASPMDSNFYKWIERLISEGHDVFVLTANPDDMRGNIEYWLAEFGLQLDIVTVESIEEKKNVFFDVLVDDSPQAYHMVNWDTYKRKLIIYDNPWNRNFGLLKNQFRAYNFRDVYRIIKYLEAHDE